MKQFTSKEQTAKLIELGLEKSKNERWVLDVANESTPSIQNIVKCQGYSIGELISLLPYDGVSDKRLEFDGFHWLVDWDTSDKIHQTMQVELIDALYDMVVKLKEEGVI